MSTHHPEQKSFNPDFREASLVSMAKRRWFSIVSSELGAGQWPITQQQDDVILLTVTEMTDDEIARELIIDDPDLVNLRRVEATVELLSGYNDVIRDFSSLDSVKETIQNNISLFQGLLDELEVWERDTDRIQELTESTRAAARTGMVANVLGYYMEIRSAWYVKTNPEYLPLDELAERTGYSSSQLGRLLRSGSISGEIVDGEWKSTVAHVADYQGKKQTGGGAPRGPRSNS